MNPTSKSPLAAALDPVMAAVLEQLRSEMRQEVEAKDRIIAEKSQALFAAEAIIQQLKEALRAERVARYGKRSEKLSDLQFQLLDLEPGVSSDEIEGEVASGPLPECPAMHKRTTSLRRSNSVRAAIIPAATSCPHIWNGSSRP